MRYGWLVAVPPLVLAAALGASKAEGGEKDTPEARYRALVGEYQARQLAFLNSINRAKTNADRRKALSAKPDPAEYAERCLEFARAHPKVEAEFDALSWILTYAPHGQESEEAIGLLVAEQVGNKRLGPVLQRLMTWRSQRVEELFRAALEKSPHREVRAMACYSLATSLATKAKRTPESDLAAGEDGGKEKSASAESPREEAEALYRTLAADYGDVRYARNKTFADLSRDGLARLLPKTRRPGTRAVLADGDDPGTAAPVGLEEGMRAPEIVGLDTNGRPMRLGDYRGAVVVLDFWGHW